MICELYHDGERNAVVQVTVVRLAPPYIPVVTTTHLCLDCAQHPMPAIGLSEAIAIRDASLMPS